MQHYFHGAWGEEGDGPGQFSYPRGIAVDSNGNVYVLDTGNHRIQKFTSKGIFLDEWGSKGFGDGEFSTPNGIAIDSNDDVYVTDSYYCRIQKFTPTGDFIAKWGVKGTKDNEFDSPTGIAVESDDDIVIADSKNRRIQKFTSDGEFIRNWGTEGTGNGQFLYPTGVAIDSNDNIYVAETDSRLYFPSQYPNFYIQKFTVSGDFIKRWGIRGSGDSQFKSTHGIATFSGDTLLVVDSGNDRIQELTNDGDYITQWGKYGSILGRFDTPIAVAINKPDDMHYIVDYNNNRIQRFHWTLNFELLGLIGNIIDNLLQSSNMKKNIEKKPRFNETLVDKNDVV